MNLKAFTKYLATGEYVPTLDAFDASKYSDKIPSTLAAHDRRFHPNGYKKGDHCKFRELLGRKDLFDMSLTEVKFRGEREEGPVIDKEEFFFDELEDFAPGKEISNVYGEGFILHKVPYDKRKQFWDAMNIAELTARGKDDEWSCAIDQREQPLKIIRGIAKVREDLKANQYSYALRGSNFDTPNYYEEGPHGDIPCEGFVEIRPAMIREWKEPWESSPKVIFDMDRDRKKHVVVFERKTSDD